MVFGESPRNYNGTVSNKGTSPIYAWSRAYSKQEKARASIRENTVGTTHVKVDLFRGGGVGGCAPVPSLGYSPT